MSRSPWTDVGANAPPDVPRLPNWDASMWSAALDSSGAAPTVSTTSAAPNAVILNGRFIPILSWTPGADGCAGHRGDRPTRMAKRTTGREVRRPIRRVCVGSGGSDESAVGRSDAADAEVGRR